MNFKARRIDINIKYDNKDISTDLKPYLLGLSYNDVLSGQADDIQITLEDKKIFGNQIGFQKRVRHFQ